MSLRNNYYFDIFVWCALKNKKKMSVFYFRGFYVGFIILKYIRFVYSFTLFFSCATFIYEMQTFFLLAIKKITFFLLIHKPHCDNNIYSVIVFDPFNNKLF